MAATGHLLIILRAGVAALLVLVSLAHCCDRRPDGKQSTAYKSPNDGGFSIHVNGAPPSYVPGASYVGNNSNDLNKVSIVGGRATDGTRQQFRGFQLSAELNGRVASPLHVGTFILYNDQHTAYHDDCINTVREASERMTSEVQVMWTAPARATGCVTFKAMVLVDSETWYSDEGGLSYQFCHAYQNQEDQNNKECCACSSAKYKMVFEGIWSKETHPRDFPSNVHFTHFSDVIGATHRTNFTFWDEGQIASDGMRQLAEWGSARGLEAELKAQARNLRTLVKAPGLWYPHVNENTTANFRTDRTRPLLSVTSMFGPSPDWIVGVSGLNLCTADCGWVDSKVIDLFPYDAGTDSGVTYNSPNEPTTPRERIHRITTMYPEDPRAPFYDMRGTMKPLARLHLNLESTSKQPCGIEDRAIDLPNPVDLAEFTEDTRRPECNVTDYSAFSPCSATCGKGFRMRTRSYVMPMKAPMLGCQRQLVSKEMCVADQPICPGDTVQHPVGLIANPEIEDSEEEIEDTSSVCRTTEYGPWSECSVTCGVGVTSRNRRFFDQWGRKKCPHIQLIERKECIEAVCPPPPPGINMDERCTVSEWSDFSPCSASCGTGLRFRSRSLLVSGHLLDICQGRVELNQQRMCTVQADCRATPTASKEVCMTEPETGPCRGFFERWYFDPKERRCLTFPYGGCRGNRNNFKKEEECNQACSTVAAELRETARSRNRYPGRPRSEGFEGDQQERVDCVVSPWSPWTPCSASCGRGTSVRVRTVLTTPSPGGIPCPLNLVKRRHCEIQPCLSNNVA